MLGARAFAGLAQPARPVQRTQRIQAARRNPCCHRASQQVVRAASDGDQEGGPTVQSLELQLFLSLIVRYPALSGTVAATAGYFLNINPLGNCHWNLHDATLGLQFAIPVLLLDAVLMLPNYSPTLTKKMIKIKVPASLAQKLKAAEALTVTDTLPNAKGEESGPPLSLFKKGDEPSGSSSSSSSSSDGNPASASAGAAAPGALASTSDAIAGSREEASSSGSGGDEEMVDVEREVSVRGEQGSLAAALYRKQLEKSINNSGRFLSWPLEGALLLTLHFAEEMLYRAVALTWAVGWTIDRLYEAGADETVGLGAASLATPQLGAALALAGCTTVSLGLLIQREFFPLKMLDKAQRDLGGGEGTAAEKERMARVLAKVKAGIRKQRLWSVSIEAVRDASEWACYGGAFLLTGNLLAPYLAAVVSDVAFSSYQRLRQTEIDKAQERASKQIGELRAVAKDMGAAKRSRVDRLQPPPLPRAPRPEEQPAEGSGGRPSGEEDKPDP